MSDLVKATTDAKFEEDVIQADEAVLVDFWAEWCPPCRAIAPLVDKAAEEYQGRLKVYKVNIDDNAEVPARYGVRGIPTLLVFKKGEVVGTKVGALSPSQLTSFLDEHTAKDG